MDLNFDELKSYEVQYLLVNLDYVVFEKHFCVFPNTYMGFCDKT